MRRRMLFLVEYAVAAVSALYLFTFGALRRGNRHFIQRIAAYFGFHPRRIEMILPRRAATEMLPSPLNLEIHEPIGGNGNVSFLELCVLREVIRNDRPTRVFELGTFDGRTTLNFAAAPEVGEIFTIDLPVGEMDKTAKPVLEGDRFFIDKPQSGAKYRKDERLAAKITQLYGDTATFDFSPYFGTVDFVFIDASHAYEYVLTDSEIALKLLRNGKGVVLWHDYGEWPGGGQWDGVTSALNHLYSSDPRFKRLQHIDQTTLVIGRF